MTISIFLLSCVIVSFLIILNPVGAQTNITKSPILDENSVWNDLFKGCISAFKCKQDSTTSWDNNSSMELISVPNNTGSWSWISGAIIVVSPDKDYEVLTHMKLNDWATESHIPIEGYNATSKQWFQLGQCPPSINGPLGWREFKCKITIPRDTIAIRPILNAGWSSQSNKQSITWFDAISITALAKTNTSSSNSGSR